MSERDESLQVAIHLHSKAIERFHARRNVEWQFAFTFWVLAGRGRCRGRRVGKRTNRNCRRCHCRRPGDLLPHPFAGPVHPPPNETRLEDRHWPGPLPTRQTRSSGSQRGSPLNSVRPIEPILTVLVPWLASSNHCRRGRDRCHLRKPPIDRQPLAVTESYQSDLVLPYGCT